LFFIPLSGYSFEKGPFFWKAEKEGRVLHILGTMHMGVALEELQCSQEISQSLAQSQLVWVESDEKLLKVVNQEVEKLLTVSNINPSRQSFQSLDQEAQKILLEEMKKMIQDISSDPIPKELLRRILNQSNYYSLYKITQDICMYKSTKNLGDPDTLSKLDLEIYNLAGQRGIPQKNLDDKEDVVELMLSYGFPRELISKEIIEKQVKSLEECYEEEGAETQEFISGIFPENLLIKNLFQKKREQGWSENIIKRWQDFLYDLALKRRNEKWFEKLVLAHKTNEEMFVAGGLAHFIDEFNVLDKLKQAGFTINRYSTECVAEESY